MSIFKRDQDLPVRQPGQYAERPSLSPQTESTERANPLSPAASTSEPTATPPAHAPAPPVNREAAAVLDRNTDLTGTLHSHNVLVEGCFQGEIEAKETIWVEAGARTQGQLRSNDAVISGSFDGQVDCQHRLQITESATISGEIKTPVLIIEEGATINCRFSMARSGR